MTRLPFPQDIDAIELVRVRVPLLEPLVASHGTETVRDVVLVHVLVAGGVEGWGECVALSAPTYTAETTDTAWATLRDVIAPGVLADDELDVSPCPMAWAALDAALADATGRATQARSARGWVQHRPTTLRDEVPCGVVVGRMASVAQLVGRVATRLAEGYRQVKLKIGPGWDVEPLRAVRERWPDLALAADANGSYRPDDADDRAVLASLDELGLAYVEQPFAPGALDDLARLRREIATPIALDESVCSFADFERAWEAGALGVLNLKPGRVGGSGQWGPIEQHVRRLGIPAFVGGMLETGIGRAYALAVASFDTFTLPTDLGPSARYVARDVTEPIEMTADGLIRVPPGAGFGVEPIPERLDEFAVGRMTIEPVRRRARLRHPAPPAGSTGTSWTFDAPTGSPAELHERVLPDAAGRAVWMMSYGAAAVVLGSTQDASVVDHEAVARHGDGSVRVVRRRSGGGAVLLAPPRAVWIDVIVPRGDELWDDDVHRSFLWLGRTWTRALAELGIHAEVHEGPPRHTRWSDLVCFAGLGPGEVTVDGRKVVGLSQRRTRDAARFQCVAYLGVKPTGRIADFLALGDDEREELRAHLEATTDVIPAATADLVAALRLALPA